MRVTTLDAFNVEALQLRAGFGHNLQSCPRDAVTIQIEVP
jgi:hypothetical protein